MSNRRTWCLLFAGGSFRCADSRAALRPIHRLFHFGQQPRRIGHGQQELVHRLCSSGMLQLQSAPQKRHASRIEQPEETPIARGVAIHATGSACSPISSGARPPIAASGTPGTARTERRPRHGISRRNWVARPGGTKGVAGPQPRPWQAQGRATQSNCGPSRKPALVHRRRGQFALPEQLAIRR